MELKELFKGAKPFTQRKSRKLCLTLTALISGLACQAAFANQPTCTTRLTNQWGSGSQVEVIIHNNNSVSLSDWHIELSYDSGLVSQSWSSVREGNNPALFSAPEWQPAISAGGQFIFGYIALHNNGLETPNIDACYAGERVTDEDQDGVADAADLCPTTPTGEAVNTAGCSASQRDTDDDGIDDAADQCPATPAGETANTQGCSASQLDDDGDSVNNAVDQCPATPAGEAVNTEGCSASQLDDDNDGITNNLDQCAATPATESVDSNGCSDSQRDSDEDGINDAADQCPATPASETANAVGCSASQLDDDSDSVNNAVDQCPATPAGEAVNTEGCSASQLDDDNDGITNNLDQCAATPATESADSNGCSASQRDSDEDGIHDAADQCPATPAGETANTQGCSSSQLDDDEDSVSNAIDQCPATPTGEIVNTEGCAWSQRDDDGDGVLNPVDLFPDNPLEVSDLDKDGIGDNSDPDIDGDGINNEFDAYPRDPLKWQKNGDFDISELPSEKGITLRSTAEMNFSIGYNSASVGDINGDGIDDFAVGSQHDDPWRSGSINGVTYVVFGNEDGIPSDIELNKLDGSNGFIAATHWSLSHGDFGTLRTHQKHHAANAGDFNGDGINDLVITAKRNGDEEVLHTAEVFIVFGRAANSPWPHIIDLSKLTVETGFTITNIPGVYLNTPRAVSAGDLNGDGHTEVLVSAAYSKFNSATGVNDEKGIAYVIFGHQPLSTAKADVEKVDSSTLKISGNLNYDVILSSAGDINGDGVDDFMLSSKDYLSNMYNPTVYVFSGSQLDTNGGILFLSDADLIIEGRRGGHFGIAMASVGDVTGDGIDDIAIGDRVGEYSTGTTYVIAGNSSFGSTIKELTVDSLTNPSKGFRIHGANIGDRAGQALASAGDFDGDGYRDLIVGAPNADGRKGTAYVVRNPNLDWPNDTDLGNLKPFYGYKISNSVSGSDYAQSVSALGDINNDGITDIWVGAPRFSTGESSKEGQGYLIYGREPIF